VQARAGEDAVLVLENGGQLVGVDAVDADAEHAAAMLHAGRAVEDEPRHGAPFGERFEHGLGQGLLVLPEVFHAAIKDVADAFGEADDADGVVRAGLEAVGHELRLGVAFAD
jgi:hypothetical protein